MATHGGKRPVRKLPPMAVASTPVTSPVETPAMPAMTAVEAAPAMPLTDIAAAPLAAITTPDAVSIPAMPVIASAPIEPAAVEPADGAHDAAVDDVIDTIDATPVAADLVPVTTPIIITQEESIMDATTTTAATAAATEKTQAFFADASTKTQGAMEKGTKFFHDVTEFSKGNVEAIVESSKIAARGFETLGQDAAAYAKSSFEGASEAMRTIATMKSPTEFMKFQADYVRSVFDSMVAQTSRGTEASLKLVGEVAQPISNRVAIAAEKIKVVA